MSAEVKRLLGQAVAEHQAGRLEEAEKRYRRILMRWPDLPDAHNLLGLVRHQRGDLAGAIGALRRAAAAVPEHPAYRYNLGNALAASRDFIGAEAELAAAARLSPSRPEVWFGLGTVRLEIDALEPAATAFRQAIGLAPDFADAHYNLGLVLARVGQPEAAMASYRAALARQADHLAAQFNLGNALWDLGERRQALASYDAVLRLAPDHVGALINRGRALMQLGEAAAAEGSLRRALAIDPRAAAAEVNLGLLALQAGDHDAAEACFRRAIAERPDHAEAHLDLGLVHQERGQIQAAMACCRAVLELEPGQPEALLNIANLLTDQGAVGDALPLYREAIERAPHWPAARSAMLFALGYDATVTPEALFAAHSDFEQFCAAGLVPATPTRHAGGDPDRPLRIGFVSADLRGHSCGYFIEPLWRWLDRDAFSIVAYSDVTRPDGATERLRGLATEWHDLTGRDDAEAAEQIRRDGIDILFDLGGHTARNRLLTFARQPAPVQLTWLGYGATTGLRVVDWRLTDWLLTPQGNSELWAEGLWRLDRSSLCYLPPRDAPEVAPTPALANGYVTFGSFNNLAKLTPETIAIWAQVGHAVPGSRFLVKARSLADAAVRDGVHAAFSRQGIAPERVELIGFAPALDSHLSLYGRLDIALDTLPYNGGTTTCEALWMGVPVLSMAGERMVSRFGLVQLNAAGCSDLVAFDASGLARRAVELASDPIALDRRRAGLRAQMAASSLCDAADFGRAVGQGLRGMWYQRR